MNKQNKQPLITETTWKQVRNEAKEVCPKFSDIIDAINPDDDLNFIKVRYPFGSKIIQDGVVNLPTETGGVMPITDTRLPTSLVIN